MDNDTPIVDKDVNETIVSSSINKAIKTIQKSGVVIIIVPGEVIFSYDLPTFIYDTDEQLHKWLKEALEKHVVLLKTSDVKIQKVIEISQQCHFDVYTVLDFAEQEVSGSAYSMTSSLPRILQSEIEMFGRERAPVTEEVVTDSIAIKSDVSDVKETTDGRFASIIGKL